MFKPKAGAGWGRHSSSAILLFPAAILCRHRLRDLLSQGWRYLAASLKANLTSVALHFPSKLLVTQGVILCSSSSDVFGLKEVGADKMPQWIQFLRFPMLSLIQVGGLLMARWWRWPVRWPVGGMLSQQVTGTVIGALDGSLGDLSFNLGGHDFEVVSVLIPIE